MPARLIPHPWRVHPAPRRNHDFEQALRTAALLRFALELVEVRGQVSAEWVQRLREHGWSDEEIVETIGQVALNLFTNYVNIALDVPVDFPRVALR